MKILLVDGTPEEISKLDELTDFLRKGRPGEAAVPMSPMSNNGIRPEVLAFVESKAGRQALRKQFVEMYLQRVLDLGGTEIEIGTSSRTKDGLNHYLMVRDSGPRRFGAVAYVRPSTAGVTIRLPSAAAEGLEHARARNLSNKTRAYQVSCHLRSEAAVAEAVQLTERALQQVREKDETGEGRR